MPDPDPRVTLSEWIEASPFDDMEELLQSEEFTDAAEEHRADRMVIVGTLDRGEYTDNEDPSYLADLGFELMPLEEGTIRMPFGGGDEAALVVPAGGEPPVFAWRRGDRKGGQSGGQA